MQTIFISEKYNLKCTKRKKKECEKKERKRNNKKGSFLSFKRFSRFFGNASFFLLFSKLFSLKFYETVILV